MPIISSLFVTMIEHHSHGYVLAKVISQILGKIVSFSNEDK